jgi:outer membrane protein OmpU
MDNKMKKTLLATTAVGLFAAASANAAGPTVTVGGYADFQVGSADQEGLYENSTGANVYSSDLHTRTDTEVYIKVDGKTDSGLGYGALIELEADVNGDDNTTNANNNAERTFIYLESGFGRVEVGATGDAGDALRVDAGTFARATGGIGGDFYQYVDLGTQNTPSAGSEFYVLPGLPTAVGLTGEANAGSKNARAFANKISYYSPRIQGLQLGVSYTPDQDERGTADGFSGDGNGNCTPAAPSTAACTQTTGIENAWNIGLNYEGEFEGFGIEASAQAEWGNTEDNAGVATTRDDLQAYAFGLAGSYAGFTLGGSYGIIDESSNRATLNTEIDYWTVGGAYVFGPFGTSVSYMDSTIENQSGTNDSEFQNLVVGADYQLAPGLMPYIEVSFFETDNNIPDIATTVDNEGTVFLVGTELNF